MSKILSVIIPTRDRQKYCLESALSILQELDETCELVIQDNSSNNSLEQDFKNLKNNIVKYNYNALPLSFIDNFENAVLLSSGKYFCILGDDDSVTADILPIVKWMDLNGVDSLASTRVVDYVWPNDEIEKYKTGLLTVPVYNGKKEFVDAKAKLIELLKGGLIGYQSYQLPRTYHGIIKKSSYDEVKKLAGRYFSGLTPDMYSTVTLSCVVKKHCIIDYPFSIAGACPESATVKATIGGHSGKLSDAPHLKNRSTYNWESIIPKYYSVETIWAETAIKAIRDVGYESILRYFNKYRLYLLSIYLNRRYIFRLSFNETLKVNTALQISRLRHVINLVTACFSTGGRIMLKRLSSRKKRLPADFTSNDILSLTEVKRYMKNYVKEIDL